MSADGQVWFLCTPGREPCQAKEVKAKVGASADASVLPAYQRTLPHLFL